MCPRISIIIPCYNAEMYLEECIESVLNQNFEEIEIICVNDGSSDGTFNILNKYKSNNKITIIHHVSNSGAGAARNTGIDIASGEYLFFIDSDDLLIDNALSTLYELALNTNADITSGQIQKFDANGNLKSPHYLKKINGTYEFYKNKKCLLGKCYVSACGRLYKRDFFNSHIGSYPVGGWCEDVVPFLKGQFYAETLAVTQAKVIKWRQVSSSVSHRKPNVIVIRTFLDSVFNLIDNEFPLEGRKFYLYFLANTVDWFERTSELESMYKDILEQHSYSEKEINRCPSLKSIRRIQSREMSIYDNVMQKLNSFTF